MDKFDFLRYNTGNSMERREKMEDRTLFEKVAEGFFGDIGVYYCGKRLGTKNHRYGPEIRSHFLLVLVEKGEATLHLGKNHIRFGSRDLLIMFPGEKICYETHSDWTIRWIGVNGGGAEDVFAHLGVTRAHPVMHPGHFDELLNITADLYEITDETSLSAKYRKQALLYQFFSALLADDGNNSHKDPVSLALEIMKYNYNNDLNIADLANRIFLDSAYFSRLFRRHVGMSPKQYILHLRMEAAKNLLATTNYSVKEIALTVGFRDPLYFSKLFLKATSLTPSAFRAANIE